MACMPLNQQIPGEKYREGEMINCVITQVNDQGKGSQVIVSRADATLVKRLFERDVPEIHKGIIEIKAIAREAGERTKMAVMSHSENIDAVGSCIGPRGARVSMISEELGGEKIDIFRWNDDVTELIKNALSPAAVLAVIDSTERKDGLIVVVNDDQLSLAIGKKGKNARLAVKLTGCKIDIKSVSDMDAMGIDWKRIAKERQERYEEEKRIQKELAQQQKYEESRNEGIATIEEIGVDYISEANVIEVDYIESLKAEETKAVEETVVVEEAVVEKVEAVEVVAAEEIKEESELERAARIAKESRKEGRVGAKVEYVSKFEEIAGNNEKQLDTPVRSRKRFDDKEERRRPTYDISSKDYEMKPIYTEEELAEIEAEEYEDESKSWINDDIDFDEYDQYYE
jgi:N utilization substance protein A